MGHQWASKSILCQCDNEAVVHIINSGTSKNQRVMGLMRCLHFIVARFDLIISATHIAGSTNCLADALSRDNLSYFFINCPQAEHLPSPIPPMLLDLLVHTQPDWTSPSWSNTFNSIFDHPFPRTHSKLIPQDTSAMSTSVLPQDTSNSQPQSRSSASLPPTSDSITCNINHSSATCPASGTSISCTRSLTHSSKICRGSNMSSGESSPRKLRKTIGHSHAFQ